jgi:16S rRNA (guanine1207-N2)-methyltransferase
MADAQPLKALAGVVGKYFPPASSDSHNDNRKIAFLNAQPVTGSLFAEPEFIELLVCEQPFRPLYLDLKRAQMQVEPDLSAPGLRPEKGFEACLIVADKFRAVNEEMLARAQRITRKGGMIFVAGAKNTGIASLRKRMVKIHDGVESFSKHHSMVFWFANNLEPHPVSDFDTLQMINADNRAYRTYRTVSGLFSANKIDPGSAMLARHFDEKIGGKVADLGAGWGYLSAQLLANCEKLTGLDLYEAHWHGVEACKDNLRAVQGHLPDRVEVKLLWFDVVDEAIGAKYDWVIMNPPFHAGRRTDLELGRGFVRSAASILKPGGQMVMVANRHLAYERILNREFSSFRTLEEAEGFKVIAARK